MARHLALLQLWRCNIGVRPAADRGVAIWVVSLLGNSLGWAPEIGRRKTTWLRRKVGIHPHL